MPMLVLRPSIAIERLMIVDFTTVWLTHGNMRRLDDRIVTMMLTADRLTGKVNGLCYDAFSP